MTLVDSHARARSESKISIVKKSSSSVKAKAKYSNSTGNNSTRSKVFITNITEIKEDNKSPFIMHSQGETESSAHQREPPPPPPPPNNNNNNPPMVGTTSTTCSTQQGGPPGFAATEGPYHPSFPHSSPPDTTHQHVYYHHPAPAPPVPHPHYHGTQPMLHYSMPPNSRMPGPYSHPYSGVFRGRPETTFHGGYHPPPYPSHPPSLKHAASTCSSNLEDCSEEGRDSQPHRGGAPRMYHMYGAPPPGWNAYAATSSSRPNPDRDMAIILPSMSCPLPSQYGGSSSSKQEAHFYHRRTPSFPNGFYRGDMSSSSTRRDDHPHPHQPAQQAQVLDNNNNICHLQHQEDGGAAARRRDDDPSKRLHQVRASRSDNSDTPNARTREKSPITIPSCLKTSSSSSSSGAAAAAAHHPHTPKTTGPAGQNIFATKDPEGKKLVLTVSASPTEIEKPPRFCFASRRRPAAIGGGGGGENAKDPSHIELERDDIMVPSIPDSPGPAFFSLMRDLNEEDELTIDETCFDGRELSSSDSFHLLPLLDGEADHLQRASTPMMPFLSKSPQCSWEIIEEAPPEEETGQGDSSDYSDLPRGKESAGEKNGSTTTTTTTTTTSTNNNACGLKSKEEVAAVVGKDENQDFLYHPSGGDGDGKNVTSLFHQDRHTTGQRIRSTPRKGSPLILSWPAQQRAMGVPGHHHHPFGGNGAPPPFLPKDIPRGRSFSEQQASAVGGDGREDPPGRTVQMVPSPQSYHGQGNFLGMPSPPRVNLSPAAGQGGRVPPPLSPKSPHFRFLADTNGMMCRPPPPQQQQQVQTQNSAKAPPPPFRPQNLPILVGESKGKCIALEPLPSKFQGDVEAGKDEKVPEFSTLVNFPNNATLRQNRLLPNGMRCCVMCGCIRPTCSRSRNRCRGNGETNHHGMVSHHPQQHHPQQHPHPQQHQHPHSPLGTNHHQQHAVAVLGTTASVDYDDMVTIPTQNKGLCTVCDISVWVVAETGRQIKWCKGCKNFRPWAAFGDKGLATKCTRCRDRQREKYALLKDSKKRETTTATK